MATTPIVISNLSDLQAIQNNLAGYYILGANIDAAGFSFTSIGSAANLFTGIFDGQGHTISNLTINNVSNTATGLFGEIGTTGAVSNVGLIGESVTSSYLSVGGLVGENFGTVSKSYVSGTIAGGAYVGALVGFNGSSGSITESYATGAANGIDDVGGLVGLNQGAIAESYATGTINEGRSGLGIGGLVGVNTTGTITQSYAIGVLGGGGFAVGGLVGAGGGANVTASYWDTQTTGRSTSGGGTGLTTAELQSGVLPAGFDPTIWFDIAGQFPELRWQVSTDQPPAHGQISPYIYDNTVFDQTSDTAPLVPWFYFFSIGATFSTAGDYSSASASYPGLGSPQTLALVGPTKFDFGSPSFDSPSGMQDAYPFGTYTVMAVGNQASSTSSVSYQANYFTSNIPFVTNYSSLNGFNPANDFTVHYNLFTPDAHVTTGFTFLTIWNANTHQVAFQDDFQSSTSTTALIPANTLSPNTNYIFELDFSDRLFVGSSTQGFDMRTDGSFMTGPNDVNRPPTIISADMIGTISKASTGGIDSATGIIAFDDPDLSDRPEASIVSKNVIVKDAYGNIDTLTDAQNTLLKQAFTIAPGTGNTNDGAIHWKFDLPNQSLSFLRALDTTVTLTAVIQIDDLHGGTVPQPVTVNLVFDPYISYVDANPDHPTPADVVGAALQYRYSLWNSDNCTGLVWAVTEAIGQPFGESAAQVPGFNSDPTHVPDQGFAVPPNGVPPGQYGPWLTIETSNWQSIVQPGDLVRIPGDANLPTDTAGHSFIVISKDSRGNWLVIDNTDPNHVAGTGAGPISVSEHTFNPAGQFGQEVLNADIAYVSRLETGPSSSFTGTTVAGTSGQPLTYGNAAAFLDGSNLQNQNITAGNGNDFVTAGSHDTIKLGQGSDVVQAGSNDTINAGNGNDQLTAGSGSIITLGNGNDTIVAGSKSIVIVGNGHDTISVGANSSVTVGNGNDSIAAGAGSTVTLGNGNDTVKAISSLIHAGEGYDKFVFVGSFGQSTITNLNLQKDTIWLDHSEFATIASVFADHMSKHGADTVIDDGHGNNITLVGKSIAELQAHQSDFHLI